VYLSMTIIYEYLSELPSLQGLCASKELPEVDLSLKDNDVLAEEAR
jgi:hypothetical protein